MFKLLLMHKLKVSLFGYGSLMLASNLEAEMPDSNGTPLSMVSGVWRDCKLGTENLKLG